MKCLLCNKPGGEILWQDDFCRIVLVTDTPDYPGFCRVILNHHVKEMTDLAPQDRDRLMGRVWKTEQAVRSVMQPDKINIASFGNVVPHLHWHVVPRFLDDRHFPNPIWGKTMRESRAQANPSLGEALRSALQREA